MFFVFCFFLFFVFVCFFVFFFRSSSGSIFKIIEQILGNTDLEGSLDDYLRGHNWMPLAHRP